MDITYNKTVGATIYVNLMSLDRLERVLTLALSTAHRATYGRSSEPIIHVVCNMYRIAYVRTTVCAPRTISRGISAVGVRSYAPIRQCSGWVNAYWFCVSSRSFERTPFALPFPCLSFSEDRLDRRFFFFFFDRSFRNLRKRELFVEINLEKESWFSFIYKNSDHFFRSSRKKWIISQKFYIIKISIMKISIIKISILYKHSR